MIFKTVVYKYANKLYYYSVIKVVQMVKQQEVAEAMQGSTHDEEFLKVDKGPTPRSNSPTEVSVQKRQRTEGDIKTSMILFY